MFYKQQGWSKVVLKKTMIVAVHNVDNLLNLIITVGSFSFDYFEVAFENLSRDLDVSMHLNVCCS